MTYNIINAPLCLDIGIPHIIFQYYFFWPPVPTYITMYGTIVHATYILREPETHNYISEFLSGLDIPKP